MLRLDTRPMIAITPAQLLTQVRIIRTDANHEAADAQLAPRSKPAAATTPAIAVPIEAAPTKISAAPSLPTADGSDMNPSTKAPQAVSTMDPATSIDQIQRGPLLTGAGL